MEAQTAQKKLKPTVGPVIQARTRLSEVQSINIQSILRAGRIQPELKAGRSNDKYEQEVDRVAEQVMRMPAPHSSQPFSSVDNPPAGNGNPHSGTIQRACAACARDEELIQAKTTESTTPEVTPAIAAGIQSLQGGVQPLSRSERHFFEPRIGADFSNMRVHSDSRAAGLKRSVNARAFTQGHNTAFWYWRVFSKYIIRKIFPHV